MTTLQRILIVQADATAAQTLTEFLGKGGNQVWQATDLASAADLLRQKKPQLVFLDLHIPGQGWLQFLREVRRLSPEGKVIITSKHPDFQRELLAKEQGVRVFLRQPFTRQWVEAALNRVQEGTATTVTPAGAQKKSRKAEKHTIRFPVRMKITLPYVILAMLFALAGAYIVTQLLYESAEDRFEKQLIETGKQSADWMVQEESRLLAKLRLVTNTQGIANEITAGNAEQLRNMVYPLAVNDQEEAIEILDAQGTSLLALRHISGGTIEEYDESRGDTVYTGWDFVQYVLQMRQDNDMDKSAGVANAAWGNYFYVSGPIKNPDGSLAGVVLVGKSLNTLVREMREDTLAETTLYNFQGEALATTLDPVPAQGFALNLDRVASVLTAQDVASLTRPLQSASNSYSEIMFPWEARGGQDLGVLGVSQAQVFLTNTSQITRAEIFILVSVGLMLVIVVGVFLANQITHPLLRVVKASTEVAHGNLDVKVDPRGNDEVAVLARSFNSMVAGLQEGSMYRDLLGRTVSPEVREQLRQTFTSGNVRLEGQEAVATVLMSDIRGFTALSEKTDPATVFNWLNEYFGDLVPIVTANNGVVNKFDGDAMLAFFGILPRLLSTKQSAYFACRAAVDILAAVERLNTLRIGRGEPPLATGIGINTGLVTAGGVGTSDRLHYTIIGDTVNTTQRLESLTRDLFNVSGAVISHSTYLALAEMRSEFRIDPLGSYAVKGKTEKLQLYRLSPATPVIEETFEEATA